MKYILNFVNKILSEEDSEKRIRKIRLIKSTDAKDDYLGRFGKTYYVKHGSKVFDILGFGRYYVSENKQFDIKPTNVVIQTKDGKDRYCNWDLILVPVTTEGVMDDYNEDLDRFAKLLEKHDGKVTPLDEVIKSLNKSARRSSFSYFASIFEKNHERVIGEYNDVLSGADTKDGQITSIVSTTMARYCTGIDPEIVENMHNADGKDTIKKFCNDNGMSEADKNYYCDLYEMIQLEIKIRVFNTVGWYAKSAMQKKCSKDPLIEELETKIDVAGRQGELIEIEGKNAEKKAEYDNIAKKKEKEGEIERQRMDNDLQIEFTKQKVESIEGLNPIVAAAALDKDLGNVHYIEAGNAIDKLGEFIPTKRDISESVLSSMEAKSSGSKTETEVKEELFDDKTEEHDFREVKPEEDIFTEKDEKEEEIVATTVEKPIVVEEEPVVNETPNPTVADVDTKDLFLEGETTVEELPVEENELGEAEGKSMTMGTMPGGAPSRKM